MTETQGTGYTLKLSDDEVQRYRTMAERARAPEADVWRLAGIVEGAAVGDIGCGPGAMLPLLAESVGKTGSVVGVDGDPTAVATATALVDAAGLSDMVSVREGRAEDTGLEPGSLDVVMMRHVLAHNGPTEQAIVDHLATLLRPGGHALLVDIDGPGIRFRPSIPALEDMMAKYAEFHALRGNDLQPGLRLDLMLKAAGLEVVDYRGRYEILDPPPGVRPPAWAARDAMVAAGVATQADLDAWDAALTESEKQSRTVFATMFTAVGQRPA
jgi:2-polyprenyl-3-methyl-5-hydroxy-6-metoxy-1,4-benzoquinol methylase